MLELNYGIIAVAVIVMFMVFGIYWSLLRSMRALVSIFVPVVVMAITRRPIMAALARSTGGQKFTAGCDKFFQAFLNINEGTGGWIIIGGALFITLAVSVFLLFTLFIPKQTRYSAADKPWWSRLIGGVVGLVMGYFVCVCLYPAFSSVVAVAAGPVTQTLLGFLGG